MIWIKKLLFFLWYKKETATIKGVAKEIEIHQLHYKVNHIFATISSDERLSHQYEKKFFYFRIRFFFVSLFLLFAVYVVMVKKELYLSSSSILVKDISQNSVTGLAAGFLGLGSSSQTQDAKVVETYLQSFDVLNKLNKKFHLRDYYQTQFIDPFHRLYPFSSNEYFLQRYQSDLEVTFDQTSGIITIGFAHADRKKAQEIVSFLIEQTEEQLNIYNHRNAQKQLTFVSSIVENNRLKLDMATKQLETYQNKHKVLDPTTDAAATTGIVTSLETSLEQKKLEQKQLSNYMNETSFDMIRLSNEIKDIETQIQAVRSKLAGGNTNRMNSLLFDFEKIKSRVEFEKEVYKESLLQLELAKVEIYKQAKTLVVLTDPNFPDTFTYPKIFALLTGMLIALLLFYGITVQIVTIVEDYKD